MSRRCFAIAEGETVFDIAVGEIRGPLPPQNPQFSLAADSNFLNLVFGGGVGTQGIVT